MSGLDLERTDAGAVLLADAVATFDGTIEWEIPAGDHTIVLLRLHAVEDRVALAPLVFHRSGFGQLVPQQGIPGPRSSSRS